MGCKEGVMWIVEIRMRNHRTLKVPQSFAFIRTYETSTIAPETAGLSLILRCLTRYMHADNDHFGIEMYTDSGWKYAVHVPCMKIYMIGA